jgi:hypothetical protein
MSNVASGNLIKMLGAFGGIERASWGILVNLNLHCFLITYSLTILKMNGSMKRFLSEVPAMTCSIW